MMDLNKIKQDIESASEGKVEAFEEFNKKVIFFIPQIHISAEGHFNTFKILIRLKRLGISFFVIEGKIGEVFAKKSEECSEEMEKRLLNSKDNELWIEMDGSAMGALIKKVYQDIKVVGCEDYEGYHAHGLLLQKLVRVEKKYEREQNARKRKEFKKKLDELEEINKKLTIVRTEKAIDKILDENVDACLLMGDDHTESFKNVCEKKKISFMVIKPQGMESFSEDKIEEFWDGVLDVKFDKKVDLENHLEKSLKNQ